MAGYGMLGHVMAQFQNSFGTALVESLEAVPVTEAGLVKSIDEIVSAEMSGRFDEPPSYEGLNTFEGDIVMEANPIAMGWFMKSVVGLTSTTSDTNLQTHLFNPRTSDFDVLAATNPLTIEQHYDVGSAAQFSDLCGNSLTFNIANGELLTMGCNLVGTTMTRVVASSPTFPAAKTFAWNQFSGSYNGGAIVDLMDLSITINNNLEARNFLGVSKSPRKIKRTGFQTIEIAGSMVFQTHSYWLAYEAQSEVPLILTFTSAQTPNILKFDMPAFRFSTYEPTIAGPGLIEASFSGKAKYLTTSAQAIAITLVNTFAGYPYSA